MYTVPEEVPQAFDPYLPYGPDNYPPATEQKAFLHQAFLEAAGKPDPARFLNGPHANSFKDILSDVEGFIHEVNPSFTPEYIMPYAFQSPRVQRMTEDMEPHETLALGTIRRHKNQRIADIASYIGPKLADQVIPRGVLDEPEYCYQGQEWSDYNAQRFCANACIRMVFNGIAGWHPREDVFAQEVINKYGRHVIDGSEYRKLFATDVFQEATGKRVTSIELLGADIKTIGAIAMRMKQRAPESNVLSIVSISSENATKDTWHECLLLGANAKGIVCNDPKDSMKKPRKIIPHRNFAERWAMTYNYAQIFIAQ